VEVLREVHEVARETVSRIVPDGTALIDHFYRRLFLLTIPVLLVCGLGLLVIGRLVFRASAGRGPST